MIFDEQGKEVALESLNLQTSSAPAAKPISQKELAVQELANTFLGQAADTAQFATYANEMYAVPEDQREHEPVNKAIRDSSQQAALVKDIVDEGYGDVLNTSLTRDNDAFRYRELKKSMHDLAKQDSAEQGIIDWYQSKKLGQENSELIEKSKAEQIAKEAGVDLKFEKDKPITRGALEYAIERQIQKKELEKQVAYYRSTGDYTALQNILLLGSAISGGIGFVETAATVAGSLALGEGAAWGLARVAAVTKQAGGILKGIKGAQKVALANRCAQAAMNTAKEAQMAGDIAKMESKLNQAQRFSKIASKRYEALSGDTFAERFGYDFYQFGRQGLNGAKASSLASTSAAFAVDGALGSIAPELARSIGDDVTMSGEYSMKDMVTGILLGGVIGGTMPVTGRALKFTGTGIFNTARETAAKHSNQKLLEGALKNNQALIQAAEKSGKTGDQLITEIQEMVADKGNIVETAQALATTINQENISDEEFAIILTTFIGDLYKGIMPNIDKLPIRNRYYSNIPEMLDTITTHIAEKKSPKELLDALEKKGIKIEQRGTGDWKNPMQEYRDALTTGKFGTTAKFANESKALGRATAFGLNQRDANTALANIYIARMGGNTEEAVRAGIAVEEYIAHLQKVSDQLHTLIEEYNIIEHANDAAQLAGRSSDFSYKYQKTAFTSIADTALNKESEQTDLPAVVRNIARMLLPEDIRKNYNTAVNITERFQTERALAGRSIETNIENYEKAVGFLAKVEQWEEDFANFLYHDEPGKINKNLVFHRLNVIGEDAGKSQTAFLEKFAQDIDNGIDDLTKLYNSDRLFAEEYSDPKALLKQMESGEMPEEFKYFYNPDSLSLKTVRDSIFDASTTQQNLETARANVRAFEDTPVMESVKEIASIQEKSAANRLRLGYFYSLNQDIKIAEEILNTNAKDIRDAFLTKLKENKYIQKIMELTGTMEGDTLLRVTNEEGKTLAKTFEEVIEETVGKKFPEGALGKEYKNITYEALENFVEYLRQNPEDGLQKLAAPRGFNAELNTPEEAAETLMEGYQQNKLADSLLAGLMNNLADSVARFEVRKLNEVNNLLSAWERCLDSKGNMAEAILGEITMTWSPHRGASQAIEYLGNTETEFKRFQMMLDKSEGDVGIDERLSEYALNPVNADEIKDAIVDTFLSIQGQLSKEEQEAFTRTVANTRAGRVAQAFLDSHSDIVKQLNILGSNKTDITRLFNSTKLSRADSILSSNELQSDFFTNVGRWMTTTDNVEIRRTLSRFCIDDYILNEKLNPIQKLLGMSKNKEQLRTANLAVYLFKNLDLDKHFNRTHNSKVNLNEIRDAIINGKDIRELTRRYGDKSVNKALTRIADGILGLPNKTEIGLVGRLKTGSKNTIAEYTSHQSKYINDLDQPLFFKDSAALKEAVKEFGYEDLTEWFQASVGNGKKAYAVLSKAGVDPLQFYNGLMDMAKVYAGNIAPKKFGEKAAEKLNRSLNDDIWKRRVHFAVSQVCGTNTSVMSTGQILAQSIIRVLSTPMLMKAGFKSLTDYSYQYQYLVTTGLRSSTDVTARYDVYSRFIKSISTDKDLINSIYMRNHLKQQTLLEMLYNEPIDSGKLKKTNGYNEWAPNVLKFEAGTQKYSKILLDKMALIEKLTHYNRMNAALNIMESVGDFASNSYADIAKINDGRLLQTLNRFGITETEWDDVLSKKAVCSMNEYLTKINPSTNIDTLGNKKMFFPELLIDLTDDEVATVMQKQNIPITADNIARYRQTLVDKASMIVNVSADEMTTIPTARVQGALSLATDPNTWLGMGIRALTQFQSFGTGVTFYHWGRRMAAHMTPDNPLFNNIFFCLNGGWTTAMSMVGFVSELALAQFLINEAVSGAAGTRKAVFSNGEFRGDILSEKIIKAYVDQAGIMAPMLDAVVTGFEKGRGAGGGFALSVLPSGSTLLGQASRVAQAATKESTQGNRAQAIGAALATNASYYTGLPNHALTQAAWNFIIGDKLTEWQQGANYNRYKSNRIRNGYVPTWVQNATGSDSLVDMLKN